MDLILGAMEPLLPLARYRTHHELLEFGVEDLYFLMAETEEFLNDLMGLGLSQFNRSLVPMTEFYSTP